MAAKKYTKKKNKKKNQHPESRSNFYSSPHIFQSLISQIRSQQGLKLPILRSLYYLLNHFSLNETIGGSCDEFNVCGFVVKVDEVLSLSDVLFEELGNRFNQLFHDHAQDQGFLDFNLSARIEELTMLLRCCMVILTLSISLYDQNVLIQHGQVLLSILGRLISVEVSWGNEKTKTSGSAPKLIPCELLEVFADELLMHKSLQESFLLIDSASSASKMLFMCHFAHGDIGTVLAVIAAHFIQSLSNDQAFEVFLYRLAWQPDNDYRIPQMSLTASLSLLQSPIIVSAPKMIQAHLILLVAEAIGIGTSSIYLKPDTRIMDYLTAFERTILLYTRHMSSLDMVGDPVRTSSSAVKSFTLGSCQLTYDSYLQPATRNMINHAGTKLNDSWDSYVNNGSSRAKSHLVDVSIAYVRENLYLFDKKFEDKILSILTSIIIRVSDDTRDTELCDGCRSPEEIYLGSILKLMSGSMSQAIWCLRRSSSSGCLKPLHDVLLRKEYDFLLHLIGGFKKYNNHLPIQKFVCEMMQAHPTRHKESKWMLLHFSALLSSSYVGRLDFIVKDCIFIMMSLLNLFAFEEGDLDAVSLPTNSGVESVISKSLDKFRKDLWAQTNSNKIASDFHKIQKLHLRKRNCSSLHNRNHDKETGTLDSTSVLNDMESSTTTEEEPVEVCDGVAFLKCIESSYRRSSDIDDLADFIECTPGKDYSAWLKNKERFRIWKYERKTDHWCDKWIKKIKSKGKFR